MRIFCVSMTVPVESRLTMRKSRNGLLRFPHGNRTGHQNPLSYEPRESLPNRAARGPIILCDRRHNPCADRDRKSVVKGKSVSVREDLGGRQNITKTNYHFTHNTDGTTTASTNLRKITC